MKKIFVLLILLFTCNRISVEAYLPTNPSKEAQEALQQEQVCMARALYHEARNQPVEGIRAVFEVIVNRSNKSGESWCATISKRKQFSFLNSGKIKLYTPMQEEEKRLLNSVKTLDNIFCGDVLFYHTTYVKPIWTKRLQVEKKIGRHIFYKLKEK